MKAGTENKLKFKQLRSRLGLREWQCGGLLDALWRFTRMNAPDGDIGRFTAEEIAVGIDWIEEPEKLIDSLVCCRWLDRAHGTLLVHDWWDHAEDSVHRQLAKSHTFFVCGKVPKLHKLEQADRQRAEAYFASHKPPILSSPPAVRPESALPDVTVTVTVPYQYRTVTEPSGADGRDSGTDGHFILVSEEDQAEIKAECNKLLEVIPPGKGGTPRHDCEFIFKTAVLNHGGFIPEVAYAGAVAATRGGKKKRNPAAFLTTALHKRCVKEGLSIHDLLNRVVIPDWAKESIDRIARSPPQGVSA